MRRASIEDFVPAGDRLYVIDILGGPSRVRVFDPRGRALAAPPVPPISSVDGMISIGQRNRAFLQRFVSGTAGLVPVHRCQRRHDPHRLIQDFTCEIR